MGTRINFFFTEAIRSLSTNIATSVAATLAMLVALFIVTVFLFMLLFVSGYADRVQDDAGVVKVFLQDTIPQEDMEALRQEMEGMPEVSSVTYVNKDEALEEAKQILDPEVLRELPSNPFPASLRMDLKDPNQVDEVSKRFEGREGVREVQYGGQQVEKAITAAGTIRWVALALSILLVLAATMLVSNTIRLSVFARRREIEVMKLVGATNSFVRLPFMIEGFLCGLAGAVGAILLAKGIVVAIENGFPQLTEAIGSVEVNTLMIFGIVLGMGILLGGVGSGLTIRKYLRV